MSKVKKGADVRPAKATGKTSAKGVGRSSGSGLPKTLPRKVAKTRRPAATGKSPARSVKVRALDPVAMCGEGTSVQFLYRVDELRDGASMAHLVFFDRHGWYCEHGRNCPAVRDVRTHGKARHLLVD